MSLSVRKSEAMCSVETAKKVSRQKWPENIAKAKEHIGKLNAVTKMNSAVNLNNITRVRAHSHNSVGFRS